MEGGHRNQVFRSLGPDPVVFKSCQRSEAAVRWLLPVLDIAVASGFVTAPPRQSLDGRYVAEGWTCEPFIPGKPADKSDLEHLHFLIEAFHDSSRSVPQRPGFLSTSALQREPQGGDVDLSVMPPDLAGACRAAWAAVETGNETVIHGDLCAANVVLCPDGRFALIDWDEARRDLAGFDLVHRDGIDMAWQRAHLAWETACSWTLEPAYAQGRAAQLMAQS